MLSDHSHLGFSNRAEAGRQLAPYLQRYKSHHPVVLALPRGGVPVAFEIAKALQAPLDLVLVRKIGRQAIASSGSGPWSTAPTRRWSSTRRWWPSSTCPRPTSKRKPGASSGRSNAAASAISVAAPRSI